MEIRRERIHGEHFVEVATEELIVWTEDRQPLSITRKRLPGKKSGIPVVLLHGFGQNRYSWHLESMSMACALAAEGFDVFNAELRGHGRSREAGSTVPTSFGDYVFLDVPAILDEACRRSGRKRVFLCGHSLGAIISYALDPEQEKWLAGIVSVAGPSHFGRGINLIALLSSMALAVYDRLGLDRLPDPKTPIPISTAWFGPLFRLPAFDWPLLPFPYALWRPGSMDRDVLRERITEGFDRTSWEMLKMMVLWAGSGRFLDRERRDVFERNLAAKRVPLLFVSGDDDRVVPAASVQPGFDMAVSRDKTWKQFGPDTTGVHWGHCDLIFGREAPRHVWPFITQWMQTRAS